jgi:hypothetical protein
MALETALSPPKIDVQPALLGPGRYFSNWEPQDHPILGNDCPCAIAVLGSQDAAIPIGIAYPAGRVQHGQGLVTTFRLVVNRTTLDGRWVCVGRRFVQLGEAAERL